MNKSSELNHSWPDVSHSLSSDISSLKEFITHFSPRDKSSGESKAFLTRFDRSLKKFSSTFPLHADPGKLRLEGAKIKKNFKEFLDRPSESCREEIVSSLNTLSDMVSEKSLIVTPIHINDSPINRAYSTADEMVMIEKPPSSHTSPKVERKPEEPGLGVTRHDQLLAARDKKSVEFAFNYAKSWGSFCREVVTVLEKRAVMENEFVRGLHKQFQLFDANVTPLKGVLLQEDLLKWSRQMSVFCDEVDACNGKRCRQLIEVLHRQHTEFERIRRILKEKWKVEVKKMVESDLAVQKARSAYHQRCQEVCRLKRDLQSDHSVTNQHTAVPSASNHSGGPLHSSRAGSVDVLESTNSMSSGTGDELGLPSSPTYSIDKKSDSFGGICEVTTQLSPSKPDETSMVTSPSMTSSSSMSSMLPPGVSSPHTGVIAGVSTGFTKQMKATRVEKLERQIIDAKKKEYECLCAYKKAVESANHRLTKMEKTKVEILCDIRLTTMKSDEVFKDTLAEYFSNFVSTRNPLLVQCSHLSDDIKNYRPGREYQSFIERHIQDKPDSPPERYVLSWFSETSLAQGHLSPNIPSSKERSESAGSISRESASVVKSTSMGLTSPSGVKLRTHSSRKSHQGLAGFAEGLAKRATVDFSNWSGFGSGVLKSSDANITRVTSLDLEKARVVVARCIRGIEACPDGINTQGIYRVSGSKAKVSLLTQALSKAAEDTSLRDETPVILASVLKDTLRSLVNPLLTCELYSSFMEIGKDAEMAVADRHIEKLTRLVNTLPNENRAIADILFRHLKKISKHQAENKMSTVNLATIFSPTLFRSQPGRDTFNIQDIQDNAAQSKSIEIMIDNVDRVFGAQTTSNDISIPTSRDLHSIGGNGVKSYGIDHPDGLWTQKSLESNENIFIKETALDQFRRRTKSVISESSTASSFDIDLREYKFIDTDSGNRLVLAKRLSLPTSTNSLFSLPLTAPAVRETNQMADHQSDPFSNSIGNSTTNLSGSNSSSSISVGTEQILLEVEKCRSKNSSISFDNDEMNNLKECEIDLSKTLTNNRLSNYSSIDEEIADGHVISPDTMNSSQQIIRPSTLSITLNEFDTSSESLKNKARNNSISPDSNLVSSEQLVEEEIISEKTMSLTSQVPELALMSITEDRQETIQTSNNLQIFSGVNPSTTPMSPEEPTSIVGLDTPTSRISTPTLPEVYPEMSQTYHSTSSTNSPGTGLPGLRKSSFSRNDPHNNNSSGGSTSSTLTKPHAKLSGGLKNLKKRLSNSGSLPSHSQPPLMDVVSPKDARYSIPTVSPISGNLTRVLISRDQPEEVPSRLTSRTSSLRRGTEDATVSSITSPRCRHSLAVPLSRDIDDPSMSSTGDPNASLDRNRVFRGLRPKSSNPEFV